MGVYSPNVPVSGDTLGGTRDRIRANFQLIASVEAINHVAFGSLGQGKHTIVQLPEINAQIPVLVPTTGVNEGALYTNQGLSPTETNLIYKAESNGFNYQLTRVISASTARFGVNVIGYVANNDGGWTFLPGAATTNAMLFQYGRRAAGGGTTVTFPVEFTNAPYSVIAVVIGATGSVTVNNITTSGFDFFTSAAAIYWQAVGV